MPDDTRGIVDPAAMLRVVDFERYPAGEALDGLVEWFWSVAWDLPGGTVHDQQVIGHPAGNISVGSIDDAGVPLDPPEGRVYGVMTGVTHRHLVGRGWTVAARTCVGGLGALLGRPARQAANRQLTLTEGLPDLDGDAVVAALTDVDDNATRTERLRDALGAVVERRDPAVVAEARQVVELARQVEHDRTVCRVEQLASRAGLSVRSLQRMFDVHVGASPSFVIRRWRILEAAEVARRGADRSGQWSGWAEVAASLGYADQAHLVRDFRRHLGVPPTVYLARNRHPSPG